MLIIRRLSLDDAKVLLEGAEKKSLQIGVPMCTAVTDEAGHLIAFSRMDGGKITSIDIAINKAYTGACARREPTSTISWLCRASPRSESTRPTRDGSPSLAADCR